MFEMNELKRVHIEISNRCQASCPMCTRNIHGGLVNPLLKISNWSLDRYKTIINEEREDAIEQVEDIIESIRMNTNYCEIAINKVKQSSTVVEILDAMESTAYEEMEETVLSELFGLESVTRED
jgi:hypothetical protein